MNHRNYKENVDEMSRERSQNKFWLLFMEDHKWSVIPAVHSGIHMELYDRTKVQKGQTIEIKLKAKHPNRKDNMWSGVVKAVGHKAYIDNCLKQMTQSYDVSQGPSLSESLLNSSAAEVSHYNNSIKEVLELDHG